ncbi:MAG: FAD-binding protein [Anaerolineales bacterium]|nr:FAD-binding protein [Anaerolineales bacterium]
MRPTTPEHVQALVRENPRVFPRGAGTKPALSTPPAEAAALDLTGLAGVTEYDPGEFTFTAWAGTPLADVQALLAEHGQYLPFDPPFAPRGATVGGTVAAGLSGPGRYRYGGVRDFILGLRWVDGAGQLVRGGGKVVKNAAGFDFPKLMVGSLGRLGVLVEATFKVFPRPPAFATLRLERPRFAEALEVVRQLYAAPLDLEALDLRPDARSVTVYVRLGGLAEALPARLDRLSRLLGGGDLVEGPDDAALWHAAREFAWAPAQTALVKVPLTPARAAALEADLAATAAERRYSAGAQVAWVAWPGPLPELDRRLAALGFSGVVVLGELAPSAGPWLGAPRSDHAFAQRVKMALDPAGRFGAL